MVPGRPVRTELSVVEVHQNLTTKGGAELKLQVSSS